MFERWRDGWALCLLVDKCRSIHLCVFGCVVCTQCPVDIAGRRALMSLIMWVNYIHSVSTYGEETKCVYYANMTLNGEHCSRAGRPIAPYPYTYIYIVYIYISCIVSNALLRTNKRAQTNTRRRRADTLCLSQLTRFARARRKHRARAWMSTHLCEHKSAGGVERVQVQDSVDAPIVGIYG